MSVGGMIYLILFIVIFLPFFIWLSFSYITKLEENSKRKKVYVGFLLSFSVIHIVGRMIFDLPDELLLTVVTIIFILFSGYMLVRVTKDKKLTY